MGDKEKKAEEELNKLEEEAYFELCQIIAEAIQLQDIKVLNTRLASWKIKYKKLLDGSTPNSSLIQKIKRLQSDQYIGYIIDLIMRQVAIKEHIRIENQSKALRKLYSIIKETNDLGTLKQKVSEWQKKYPVESFLKMYKNRIASYTSTKNLEENAFDQDKAFSDLVQITKINGSFEELSQELEKWEKEYSIHDKFELDDFIKNQTEVKRYTSSEYLLSISNQSEQLDIDTPVEIIKSNSNPSSLANQASAYSSLVTITSTPNNIDKVFEWVYKNNKITFNDEYKELILSTTYLDYSPTYLNKLEIPDINVLSSSLTFDEYVNIKNIKRYAAISYFNLLLPPEKRIDNNFFNKYLRQIHDKSDKIKHQETQIIVEQKPVIQEPIVQEPIEQNPTVQEPKKQNNKVDKQEITISINEADTNEITVDNLENLGTTIELTATPEVTETIVPENTSTEISKTEEISKPEVAIEPKESVTVSQEVQVSGNDEDILDSEQEIIIYSPVFFDTVYNFTEQAELIDKIDSSVSKKNIKTQTQDLIDLDIQKNNF